MGVVDQPDRVPLTIPQYLKHRCVVRHWPATMPNQDAGAIALQRHDPLAFKLHR